MVKSMTGYGKGEAASAQGKFIVEIRSVNHRYGEISVRMPRQFQMFEVEVKRHISSKLKRGKIEVYVSWEETVSNGGIPQLQTDLAAGYFKAFTCLADELGIEEPVPLSLVIAQKGVIQETLKPLDEEILLPLLIQATEIAVNAIEAMRVREGELLLLDLNERKTSVENMVKDISDSVPLMVSEYQRKFKIRLEQLLGDTPLDQERLHQEVALLADRCDVTEELVRLGSHFVQWQQTLSQTEPVGRKLDFLMQEMNREVNTIGSKANDNSIATLVIQIKAEMEKMREQVQNIE